MHTKFEKFLPNDRFKIEKATGKGRPKKVPHDQLRLSPNLGNGDSSHITASAIDTTDTVQAEVLSTSVSRKKL